MRRLFPAKLILKSSIMFIVILSIPGVIWGWNFAKSNIPLEDIMSGGPPKDGIPALLKPAFVKAPEADYMRDNEKVVGLELNGIARAYPTRILSWHESVNDTFGGLPVLVSW